MKKSKIAALVTALVLSIGTGTVYAEDTGTITNADNEQFRQQVDELVYALQSRDLERLNESATFMTTEAYYDLRDYIGENSKNTGILKNYVMDYVEVSGSTDGDEVMLINVTSNNGDKVYYTLYELHINKDKQIYGINVWVY